MAHLLKKEPGHAWTHKEITLIVLSLGTETQMSMARQNELILLRRISCVKFRVGRIIGHADFEAETFVLPPTTA